MHAPTCIVRDEVLQQWLDKAGSQESGEVLTGQADSLGQAESLDIEALSLHINHCHACQQRLERWLNTEECTRWRSTSLPENSELAPEILQQLQVLDRVPTDGSLAELESPEQLYVPGQLAHYQLIGEIGRGGMGVVYHALDNRLGREVAIKVFQPPIVSHDLRVRFIREGQAMAAIDDSGVMPVYEVIDDSHCLALVMPWMQGGSLSQRIKDRDYSYRQAAQWTLEVAYALATIHRFGYVHRDIKPANILLDLHQRIRVSDFGLVKWQDDMRLTGINAVPGTPEYLSPEALARSTEPIGPLSDIYQCGVLLYELMVGHPPFQGNLPQVLQKITEFDLRRPRSLCPDIPRDLEVICLKAMNRQPAGRYAAAAELAEDLERFLNGYPILAKPPSAAKRLLNVLCRYPRQSLAGTILAIMIAGMMTALLQYRSDANVAIQQQTELADQATRLNREYAQLSQQRNRDRDSLAAAQALVESNQQQTIQLAINSIAPSIPNPDEAITLVISRIADGMEESLNRAISLQAEESEITTHAVAAASGARMAKRWEKVQQHSNTAIKLLEFVQSSAIRPDQEKQMLLNGLLARRMWLESAMMLKQSTTSQTELDEFKKMLGEFESQVDQNALRLGLSRLTELFWVELFRLHTDTSPHQRQQTAAAWQLARDAIVSQPAFRNLLVEASRQYLAMLSQLEDLQQITLVEQFLES